MAGHSKWANTKHRKARSDAKKGKIFSRLAKEIISAVKAGGSDPKSNSKLKLVLQKARAANAPNEIIERNIKKGANADQSDYFAFVYELYGHGGVGIIAEGMSDNKNRLSSEMRIATNKKGGTVATPGAVAFNFDQKGVIQVKKGPVDSDTLFLVATDTGAEDFDEGDEIFIITTASEDLFQVKEALSKLNVEIEEAEFEMLPKTYVDCTEETAKMNLELIEWLENIDDIDSVYHNMKIPDALT